MEDIEILKDLIIDIGMSATTIIIILFVFYRFVKKFIEGMIESVIKENSDKSIENYINDLNRKTIVYENLVNKELKFYEKTEDYISDIVVEIQDVQGYYLDCLKKENEEEKNEARKKSLNELLKIMKVVPEYKKDIIMFGNYIDDVLENACSKFLVSLQDNTIKLADSIKKDSIEKDELENIVSQTLAESSCVMVLIRERYENLSKGNNLK